MKNVKTIKIFSLSLLFLLTMFACKNNNATIKDTFTISKVIADSFGKITMELPKHYDTNFIWQHGSDCNTCGYYKERWQPKNKKIFLESGFFWIGEPTDSVEAFTISYKEDIPPFKRKSLSYDTATALHFKDNAKHSNFSVNVTLDTFLSINGKFISIIEFSGYDSLLKTHTKEINAFCNVNQIAVNFTYVIKQKQTDKYFNNFSSLAIKSIKTITVEEY